jgi:hypothetical protein
VQQRRLPNDGDDIELDVGRKLAEHHELRGGHGIELELRGDERDNPRRGH